MVDQVIEETDGSKMGIYPAEKNYVRLTDEEIKTLAQQLIRGEIYGSWMVREPMRVDQVFMVLFFIDEIHRKALVRDEIVHFYEFLNQAGPMAVNGYPTFFSGHPIDQHDFDRLIEKARKIQKAMEEA